MTRRLLLPLLAVLATFAAFPATGQARYTLAVSDQQASAFLHPLFAPLNFRAARYITPYDVLSDPVEKGKLDAWLAAARTRISSSRLLISFEHSRRRGREARMPSVATYRRAITRFRRAYPFIREISPWNEVNRKGFRRASGSYEGQPTYRSPRRVAQYYMTARRVFRGRTIVGIDLLDGQNVAPSLRYLRTFLRYAKPRPRIIGLHNYSDTNRKSSARTRAVLRMFGGQVWLTETGGIVKLGRSFPFSTSRAARSLGCMFSIARSNRRVTRLYVYHFHASPPSADFDAGLVNANDTPRPGYNVVKSRRARACG